MACPRSVTRSTQRVSTRCYGRPVVASFVAVASPRAARAQGAAARDDVTPPQAIRRVDAIYPQTGPREEVDVVLVVTVGEIGRAHV